MSYCNSKWQGVTGLTFKPLTIVFVFTVLSCCAISYGQNKALVLRSGLQIEGVGGSLDKISASLAHFDPYKSTPIVVLDNGLKRVFVSRDAIANDQGASMLSDTEIDIWQRESNGSIGHGILLSATPLDENGHRTIWIRDVKGAVTPTVQGVTKLNPLWTELASVPNPSIQTRRWDMKIATKSIPPDVLRGLLHRSIDSTNFLERMDVVEFYVELDQYRRAIEEIRLIEVDFEAERGRLQKDRERLNQEFWRQILREARFRDSVGQSELASKMASSINPTEMANQIQADFLDFQQQNKAKQKELEQLKKDVIALAQRLIAVQDSKPEQQKVMQTFIQEIEADLRHSNSDRLASYRRVANGDTTTDKQLASLAISGWLLGSNKATENLAIAESMFPVRDLVKEYLAPATPGRREQILEELIKFEAGEPDYLAPIIYNITPPQAPDLSSYTGEHALEFEVVIKGTNAQDGTPQKFKYLVHLPAEYDPYRKYPCMLTLRSANSAKQQLERWTGQFDPNLGTRMGPASRHGYVVVSLDWKQEGQGGYEHSAREHKVILKCMRECLKKFSIDTDRVFLSGHGFGAEAAYDVAISHPEHWAGVIGIAGKIGKYPTQYFENQHLGVSVYSVVGTKDVASVNGSTTAWNKWLTSVDKLNTCQVVEYHGRLSEPFIEEFPAIMEWCSVNRRRWPSKAADFEIDCEILRPWDNYYWFVEFHGLPRDKTKYPEAWLDETNLGFKPLHFSAKLHSNQPNTFKSLSPGPRVGRGMTIWLSPDYVDFKEKIIARGRGGDFKDFVVPDRKTMLEDVRRRGDRMRPFWGKIDLR